VLQSFAPQDVVTAEHLSKLMPLTVMTAEQHSRSFGAQWQQGVNTSDQPMPVMLPQHLRNMDDGFSVLFSHKLKGPLRTFFPYKVAGLDEIYARDPS
jgi:type IV secretory pathway TraG/TraD family ATPase VirD4